MSLSLQKSDTSAELLRNGKVLILRRQNSNECRIVGTDKGDIGVLTVAKGGMAIAWISLSLCWCRNGT